MSNKLIYCIINLLSCCFLNYVYEKDVISKVAKARRLKINDTKKKFQKIRVDIYNKYDLNTCRLTKELYNQLEIKEKYSSKNVIYKLN